MIKIKQAKNGQFFFTIQAKNGQVIVTSETYRSKAGARKGVLALARCFGFETWNYIDETVKK